MQAVMNHNDSRLQVVTRRSQSIIVLLVSALGLLAPGSCIIPAGDDMSDWLVLIPHGDCVARLVIRGHLVAAETGDGIAGVEVSGGSLTAGEYTTFGGGEPSGENGEFTVVAMSGLGPCGFFFGPLVPEPPEQFEIFAVRDGCENRFLIDVSDETASLVELPEEDFATYELLDPLPVPPCEAGDAGTSSGEDQEAP